MQKITLFLLATLYVSCSFSQANAKSAQNNSLSAKEKSDGWMLLFDGQSTNGWHSYGRTAASKAWIVKDGTIYLDAEGKKN